MTAIPSKLAFFTDLQTDDNPPCDRRDARGQSIRFVENNGIITRGFEAAVAAGADAWMFGGDGSEKKNPTSLVQRALASHFRWWLDQGKDVFAIPGNHDGSDFGLSSSSIEPLAILGGPRFHLYQRVSYDPVMRIIYIPYIHGATPAEIRELLVAEMAPHMATLGTAPILAVQHYGSRDASVGPDNNVLKNDYLGADLYEGFPVDHVLCGHIHKAQESEENGIFFHTAGSPVIHNHGERNDRKTWGLWDQTARTYTINDIAQPRRWISVDWKDVTGSGEIPWGEDDIVRIVGEHQKGEAPRQILEAAFKGGTIPRPFHLKMEVKQHREQRVMRSEGVNTEGGLKAGLLSYIRDEFHRESDKPGHVEAATRLVLDVMSEQESASYCAEVTPVRITGKNFATFFDLDYTFTPGDVVLFTAPNGTGKSKFHGASYFCVTGELTDGGDLADAVFRTEASGFVSLELRGNDDSRWLITRVVKVSAAGAASQTLTLDRFDVVTGDWDRKSFNDGGVKDRQARIDRLVGGSPAIQRLTAWSVQDDERQISRIKPTERKNIISEATGQEPLRKAGKNLNDRRINDQRDLKSARDRLLGLETGLEGADDRMASLTTSLEATQAEEKAAAAKEPGLAEAASKAASEAEAAKAKVTTVLGQIGAIPNTGAAVEGARARRDGRTTGFETFKTQKRTEFDGLTETITSTQTNLEQLAVPGDDEAKAADEAEVAARQDLDHKGTVASSAKTRVELAESQKDFAAGTSKTLGGDKEKLEAELAALVVPEIPDTAEAEAEIQALATATTEIEAKYREAGERKAVAQGTVTRLKAELAEIEGATTGKCSKCHQDVTAEHLEAERKSTATALEEAEAVLLIEAEATRTAGLEIIDTRDKAVAAMQKLESLKEQGRAAVTAAATRARLSGEIEAVAAKITKVEEEFSEAVTRLQEATAAATTADADLVAARAANEAAATKAHQIREARAQAAEWRATITQAQARKLQIHSESTAEKSAYDADIAKLNEGLDAAIAKHTEALALADKLQTELTTARGSETEAVEASARAASERDGAATALTALRTRIDDLNGQIEAIKEKKLLVEDAKFQVGAAEEKAIIASTAAELIEAYRIRLIDQALPFIEERTNFWLDKLGAGVVTVELATLDGDKETLLIRVNDGRPGRPLDIRVYSGGQKRRVEMALKLALSELKQQALGAELMLMSADEPTDGLDAAGRKAYVEMILAQAASGKVIILTSHDNEIIASFNNVIRLTQGPAGETIMEG